MALHAAPWLCRTLLLSPFPPGPQVCEQAEAKEAELNAHILRLESHIHWLGQENTQLQQQLKQQQAAAGGSAGAEGAAEGAAAAAAELRAQAAALEGELRKSKRAEQKLQVGGAGTWPLWACLGRCLHAFRALTRPV